MLVKSVQPIAQSTLMCLLDNDLGHARRPGGGGRKAAHLGVDKPLPVGSVLCMLLIRRHAGSARELILYRSRPLMRQSTLTRSVSEGSSCLAEGYREGIHRVAARPGTARRIMLSRPDDVGRGRFYQGEGAKA